MDVSVKDRRNWNVQSDNNHLSDIFVHSLTTTIAFKSDKKSSATTFLADQAGQHVLQGEMHVHLSFCTRAAQVRPFAQAIRLHVLGSFWHSGYSLSMFAVAVHSPLNCLPT